MKSYYQLIKTITKSEKKVTVELKCFNLADENKGSICFLSIEMHENRNPFRWSCPITARVNDAYCPITQAWHVLSNYTVL